MKIAAATGLELAIDIAPAGQEPKLVGKTVKDALKCRFFVDGASRDRTGDLYNAIVALSQLSYGPERGARG